MLAYLAEGTVRAWTETGATAHLAAAEIALVAIFFACAIRYVRATGGR